MKTQKIIQTANASLPTIYGTFLVTIYKEKGDEREHAVLQTGDIKKRPLLTRVHSQCLTGDTLFSLRCDCGEQLAQSMKAIQKEASGIILYLNQEGRGIGLTNKIKAYALQDQGLDTVEANHALGFPTDARDYAVAAAILRELGIEEIALLTNNPTKIEELKRHGIRVKKRVSLETKPNPVNIRYLATKKQKMAHKLIQV